jgi:DmsE family decaheme c-type cytochrome
LEHSESDGDIGITNPEQLEAASESICLSCHKGEVAQNYWRGSEHEAEKVSCVSCHSMHGNFENLMNTAFQPATCFKCHPEQRRFLFKRSSHPLRDASRKSREGKMNCSSCHNPHGSQSDRLIAANSINDKCYECHQEMKAPVLWEHSPVKENCLNCHNPHGSNYEKLLTAKRPRLCQQCHEAGRHQTLAGQPASFLVMNRGCSNCHAQVHGTNHPSGLKLKR